MTRLATPLAAALALALPALPASAAEAEGQDPATRDRFNDQERRLQEQEKRIQDLERRLAEAEARAPGAPPSAESLDAAVRRYLEERKEPLHEGGGTYRVGPVERPANPRFRMGGYTSILYRSPDDPDGHGSFEGLRFVPQFSFDISEGIDFAAEVEFERGGVADEFLDDSEVLVEYAETRFRVAESFVPKAGILLLPFLRYNLYHDDPIWNLQDRPTTARRVFKTALQQPGVGAEGVLPFGEGHSFNYNLALTDGMDDEVDNGGFEDARQDFRADNNDDKTIWARLGAAPRLPFLDAADLGVSFATGRMDSAGDPGKVRMTGWGLDGKVTRDRFDLIFEWTSFHYDRPNSQPAALFPRQTHGAFVEVDAHLLRGLPRSGSGLTGPASELVLAARYEWADLNERVHGASMADDTRALVVGLAFRFTPKSVVRVERRQETTGFNGPGAEDLGQWVVSYSTYF